MAKTKHRIGPHMWAIALAAACFQDPGYPPPGTEPSACSEAVEGCPGESSGGSTGGDQGSGDGVSPEFCGNGMVESGELCDQGPDNGPSGPCLGDCTPNVCGDGFQGPAEECDDGNMVPGDGCSPDCVASGCAPGAEQVGTSAGGDMALCRDPQEVVCEQDFDVLCAPGWGLCTPLQFVARNDGWTVPLQGRRGLGAMRCRSSGGAGHFTVVSTHIDVPANCIAGSSLPQCPSAFGCTETTDHALCCRPTPTCGDGIVQSEEECDDGNTEEDDDCDGRCMARTIPGEGCG